MSRSPRRSPSWLAAGLLLVLSATTQANTRFYVDPALGINSTSPDAGSESNPFRTIGFAIAALDAGLQPGVVVLAPGIYSSSTNMESFPILMRDGVSIQGTSALNTILRGDLGDAVLTFQQPAFFGPGADVVVDGVTLTGGDEGVRIAGEVISVEAVFSNCFIVDNTYGVFMEAPDLGVGNLPPSLDGDQNGFPEFRPKFINCTIADNDIGIYDTNALGGVPGIGVGEAEPCIVNCIIYPNEDADLEGVDGLDILASAFLSWGTAGLSVIKPLRPAPSSIVPNGSLSPLYISPATGDYRLASFTHMEDLGTANLSVPNGTSTTAQGPCDMDIFDFDAEGFCNARVEGSAVDLGADERGALVISGYRPWTTQFGTDPMTSVVYDQLTMTITASNPAMVGPLNSYVFLSGGFGYMSIDPAPQPPGMRAQGTIQPTLFSPFGFSCLDAAASAQPFRLKTGLSGVPKTFSIDVFPVLLNMQVLPTDFFNQFSPLSNVQSFVQTF